MAEWSVAWLYTSIGLAVVALVAYSYLARKGVSAKRKEHRGQKRPAVAAELSAGLEMMALRLHSKLQSGAIESDEQLRTILRNTESLTAEEKDQVMGRVVQLKKGRGPRDTIYQQDVFLPKSRK